MNQPDFDSRAMTARVVKHLSYDAAIDYLATLRGREQIVRVTLGPPLVATPGDKSGATKTAHVPLVEVLGVIGEVIARPRQAETPSTQSGSDVTLTIGNDCQLELSADRVKGATRLALGPEVNAIVLNLGDASVLVQDVLTETNLPGVDG